MPATRPAYRCALVSGLPFTTREDAHRSDAELVALALDAADRADIGALPEHVTIGLGNDHFVIEVAA